MKLRFTLFCCVVALLFGCTAPPPSNQTEVEKTNKEIVLSVFEALESGDLETLERYFPADGKVIIGLEERERGGPKKTFKEAAPFPGSLNHVSVSVEHIVAESDNVAIQSKICGDHAATILGFEPTGERLCSRYINMYTLKDGKIVENSVGVHRDQLRAQLEKNSSD